MADSHSLKGSANTRSNSHILAESLTNIVESCNESYTLDKSISVIWESISETNIAAGERKIFETVVNDLNSISGKKSLVGKACETFSKERRCKNRDEDGDRHC
jgi:E3 ubiquitin-protein ligase DOA10